ncbi:Utp21 specific WD40 associated putative domain-containing protein [Entophlyctis helioformis]|nr:Utp21 specific WD40 associated putative domain-containing protein [Entophlyctis helioformis]
MVVSSKKQGMFTPFRALGYVTADVPLSIQARGQAHFITSSIGDSFQIFDGDKMRLLFVGPKLESPITSIASFKDLTFASSGSEIIVFNRAKESYRLSAPDSSAAISNLFVLGNLVFGLGDDNALRIWDFFERGFHNEISFSSKFTVTAAMHPSTYLNKVLVGSQQGTMQLWNILSMKLIYEFKSFGSPIVTLEQSPSIDVIAIGLLDGSTVLYNIKVDKEILRFRQEGKVTAITFRTDGQPIMATANMYGDVSLWDLEERRLMHVMKGAHDAAVHTCMFYNGMPILVTASSDNSIKQWLFDSLDGLPRLLKLRSGHHKPPTGIRHYDDDGRTILSAGQDQALRSFSIIRDAQNVELSQGSLEKKAKKINMHIDALKLPQIVQFAANQAKEKEWDNVLTCHMNQSVARTWNHQRKAIGRFSFATQDGSAVKSVALSVCGNYGFIGSSKGRIERFNMQSGLLRMTYAGQNGHTKAVTAITSDGVNRLVISSSLDQTVKFWDFNNGKLLETIRFDTAISHMVFHNDSSLLAVATDDLCIRVVDIETKKVVREFWGHHNRITDMAVSRDGRWIVSSSLDGTIRTWDLPTGYLIDGFRVADIPTSVSLSPTGDFLATTHVNHVGIFLWANRSQYENVPVRRLDDEDLFATAAALPASGGHEQDAVPEEPETDAETDMVVADEDKDAKMQTPQDLVDDMITLSTLPKSRWQNLLSLEAIKKRNKPIEAPKAPAQAPFFLPTLPGAVPKFAVSDDAANDAGKDGSRIFKNLDVDMNELARLLKSGNESGDYSLVMEYLKTLSPSAVDVEIRMLPMDAGQTHLCHFLEYVVYALDSQRDFELVHAYLNVFLKIHGDVIQAGGERLREALTTVQQRAEGAWGRLETKLQYALCVVDFARGAGF